MTNQNAPDRFDRATPTFEQAREFYKHSLQDLARDRSPADWPAFVFFVGTDLELEEDLHLESGLPVEVDFETLGNVIIPGLVKLTRAQILGFATRGLLDPTDREEINESDLIPVLALQVATRDRHECWVVSLEEICSPEFPIPTWQEVDPALGLLAEEIRHALCPQG